MSESSAELRRQARLLRHSAQHAERLKDARSELEQAARLEARADLIDGIKPSPPPPPVTPEQRQAAEQRRRARIDAAFAQITARFGRA